MIYPYEVKYNGKYYEAGENVPEGKVASDDTPDEVENKKPTKTQINTMSKADLVELARSVGISDAEEKSGSVIKELLIEHFGL